MPRPLYRFPFLLIRERRASGPRPRVAEPMVWADPHAVEEFHKAAETANALRAVYDFSARAINALTPEGGRVMDLGSGSGQFLAFVARRRPDVSVVGLELSEPMLETGNEMLASEGFGDRVALKHADVTAIPEEIASQPVDTISSLLTLHHLPDADALDSCLRGLAELRERHGCAIWLFDLARMNDPRTWPAWTHVTDPGVAPVLRDDAIASERAAWTRDELGERIAASGLSDMRSGRSPLVPMLQAWWCPPADGATAAKRWVEIPLKGAAKGDARFLVGSFKDVPDVRHAA